MDKIDAILENVEGKINSLNGLFSVIDFTTDRISSFSDRVVDLFGNIVSRIGSFGASKRRKKKERDIDE